MSKASQRCWKVQLLPLERQGKTLQKRCSQSGSRMKSAFPTPRKNFSLSSRQRKQLSHTKHMCKTGPWCWEPGGKRTSEGLDHLLSLNTPPLMGFPGGPVVKNLPANAGEARDMGLIPGLGRPSGEGNSKPLYSCLENPMDKGAWWDTVHWVTEGQIQLSMS